MLKKTGYSNKKFYYLASGKCHTFNMHMRIFFNEKPDSGILKSAIKKTLAVFPEMAIRPVIGGDGTLYSVKNSSEPAVFEENGVRHALGSDETNGYLFCALIGKSSITLSFFHGLSDFVGNWSFIRTLLYHYALESGRSVRPDDCIRLNTDLYDGMDERERDDPYSLFAKSSCSQGTEDDIFSIPGTLYPADQGMIHSYDVIMRTQEILDRTKALGTSFVPLITAVIGKALDKLYDIGTSKIVSSVPVSMHKLYNTKTTANFSDSIILRLSDPKEYTIEKMCKDLESQMHLQMNHEHFGDKMDRVIKRITGYERSGSDIEEISDAIWKEPVRSERTYMLTYPGKIYLPSGYESFVSGFNMEPILRNAEPALFAGDYGDEFRIRICQDFDNEKVAMAVAGTMTESGISASFRDAGIISGDYVDIGKIRRVTDQIPG